MQVRPRLGPREGNDILVIDLHCHILHGIDDGATSPEMSLRMARIAVADGITTSVCTPHIYPGVFENTRDDIRHRVERFGQQLAEADIALRVRDGAEIQMIPEIVQGLRSGRLATLNSSRYLLFEPPHFSAPRGFTKLIFYLLAAGYIPIIAHPERLAWLDKERYHWIEEVILDGAWIQVTAGSLNGRFGKAARAMSERLLGDGLVHLIATDAHDDKHRPPILSTGRRAAERRVGAAEAERMVLTRPQAVLENLDPGDVVPPPALQDEPPASPARPRESLGARVARLLKG